ncbi:molybdenum cofactor biosynthesis protein MoaE [Methanobrevibacter filiformis]|uniref:Molybdopterin synthase catalytic subunit n=1 Tax=Methanobrevibacter filiformis TaxID=55758 RepID=A0A166AVH7_9EURY|nr:molybdenum cofactor biosynthesis protein MoaE [Methanobrevibacter filiformis]KZX12521.1 molybdopterin synthase catalytic subunit [Methanobrevibacter filiformis]
MFVKVVKKDDEYYTIADIVDILKKNDNIDDSGAIFTFEGFVRGKEDIKKVDKLLLTTPNKEKTEKKIGEILEEIKTKHGVFDIVVVHFVGEFYTGDSLFLVGVLGPHRTETLDALSETIERTKYDVDFKKEEIANTGTTTILCGG